MRKISTSPPSEAQEDDLLPEYRFDYRHAKPNRFADEGARQKKGEPVGTKKIVRSAITGRFVKPPAAKSRPKRTVTETVKTSPKRKK
jgi:hypothetical protein